MPSKVAGFWVSLRPSMAGGSDLLENGGRRAAGILDRVMRRSAFPGCRQPSLQYRPDVDGLRAIAVMLVLNFHAFPQAAPGGFVGVDVFFVISGFLITGLIAHELESEALQPARLL